MSNLVIVEYEEQVRDILQNGPVKDPTWVAGGPGAMFELEQRTIPFTIIEDYYQIEDLRAIGRMSRSRVRNICDAIDELLKQSVTEVKDLGITPTLFCLYPLSMVMDVLAARTFQIKRLIAKTQPDSITVHGSASYPFGLFGFCFDNHESLYAHLLRLKGWETSVNFLPEVKTHNSRTTPARTAINNLKGLIARSYIPWDIAMKIRCFPQGNLRWLISNLTGKKGGPKVCVYMGAYELPAFVKHLAHSGIRINFFPAVLGHSGKDIVGDEKQTHLLKELEENKSFRDLFIWEGIDTYPLMKQRIAYLLKDNVNKIVNIYQEAGRFFERRKISSIVMPIRYGAKGNAICSAARNNNTMIFSWQDGSTGYYRHHTMEFTDLFGTDVYLGYGEGVCQFWNERAKSYQVMVKPVGSIQLDALRNRHRTNSNERTLPQQLRQMKSAGKRLCLYATTNYFQNNWNASYEPPPSDNHFYQTQMALVKGLLSCPEIGLMVKPHPNPSLRQPPWLSYLQKKNSSFIFSSERTFSELLDYPELIVLDWPTTTMLQSITTDKPVFVVVKHLHLLPEARLLLERRAVCADEPLELVDSVKRYLTTGIYPADINDNCFLKAYGTHLDDGRSAERALAAILERR